MAEPIVVREDGSVELRLGAGEVDAITRVVNDLVDSLGDRDPSTQRLYPVAFPDDAVAQAEFERMTRDDQGEARARAAGIVLRTIGDGTRRRGGWACALNPEEQQAWLTTINSVRLVLGTGLGVTEEMDHEPLPATDPRAPGHNLYLYLSGLLELFTEVLLDRIEAGER